jgi:hypothetical protein
MIPDNNQHVIISHGFGGYTAYPCTVEVAKRLLADHMDALDEEVQEIADILQAGKDASEYLVIGQTVVDALVEITTLAPDAPTRALRRLMHGQPPTSKSGKPDTRPEVFVSEALRDEVVLWAFKKGLNPQALTSIEGNLPELAPHESLSFMTSVVERAKGLPVRYVRASTYDSAYNLRQLQHGTWKESAQEHRVVQHYLEFVRDELAHRDDRYDIAPLKASY